MAERDPEELLEAIDVAEMHDISVQAVYQAIAEGRLKAEMPRKRWRIRRADAEAWQPRKPKKK